MPDGQYSIYLHSDDRTDIAAMSTISTISQPLRGEFIRTVATAGAVVYRTDPRLPELIPVFFDGQLSAIRLCAVMALVTGAWSTLSGLPDISDAGLSVLTLTAESESKRRRYTLALQDDRSGERIESLLMGVSSRLRGQLLRNLIITGLALHTIAPELPRLLSSLPVPPATVSELQKLVMQMVQKAEPGLIKTEGRLSEKETSPAQVSPEPAKSGIRNNMRRAFGE